MSTGRRKDLANSSSTILRVSLAVERQSWSNAGPVARFVVVTWWNSRANSRVDGSSEKGSLLLVMVLEGFLRSLTPFLANGVKEMVLAAR